MADAHTTVVYTNRIPPYLPKYQFPSTSIPSPSENPYMSHTKLQQYETYTIQKPLAPHEENNLNNLIEQEQLMAKGNLTHQNWLCSLPEHIQQLQMQENQWHKRLRKAQRWEFDRSYAEKKQHNLANKCSTK